MPPSSQTLRTAFQTAASQWPKDVLRPSLQFSDSIRKASDRIFLPSAATTSPETYQGPLITLSKVQHQKAEQALASLHRLIENRALKSHPMTERTSKPASFPKHYARIQDAIDRTARGEVFKKKWFPNFRWK
ncbi:ubiquinol-cytochrome c reductase complex assembly factor 2 [Sporobolomyces salmoneus]|uniref:ubiquinol-cytochrome c reductase complex assembly factor 2 n=1 Tax=Sporobolomyces salmoneus TaxID=183962 RepID=UPI003170A58D